MKKCLWKIKVMEFDNRRNNLVSNVVGLKIGLVVFVLGRLEELTLLIENRF